MASIRKLEGRSKPWQVRIRRQGKSIAEYFRTKKEASEFAAKVEADFSKWSRLLDGESKRHSLAELIDRYVAQWSGRDHNLQSRLSWWKDNFGDRPISEFDSAAVREGLAKLEVEPAPHGGTRVTLTQKPRSPSTVNRYKAAISAVFKTAQDKGWLGVTDNPVSGIRSRSEKNNRFGRCLSESERVSLIEACDRSGWHGLGVFVRLALATGARRGELLKLRWSDVELNPGAILLRETKNDDDRRVPVVGEALHSLKEWAKIRKVDDDRVFPGSTPGRLPQIDSHWSKAKKDAGIENFRIHDLRHSCGSYLAKAGASAFQIAAILGHRSGPGLTARYVHLAADDSRAIMEAALGGASHD